MKRTNAIALALAGFLSSQNIVPLLKAAGEDALPANPAASGTPKILFETTLFDFGKITAGETLSGAFKFKNAGNAILKVDPPEASCDCTEPKVKPDSLAPGESGEILYTIKLDHPLNGQRFIRVHSNDPETPAVELTIKLDYTPLYELSPKLLRLFLPAGKDEIQGKFIVTRVDGKPLEIDRMTASQPWISAAFAPTFKPEQSPAQVIVTVHRPPGPPALFSASVQLWNNNHSDQPMQTLALSGEILGEVAAVPPRLYWVIPDFGQFKAAYPSEALTRKIELTSVLGHEVALKNATTDIQGMSVQIVPKEAGKRFDLLLKFDELPKAFTNGKVTIETSLASLPKVEVPITVSVPN